MKLGPFLPAAMENESKIDYNIETPRVTCWECVNDECDCLPAFPRKPEWHHFLPVRSQPVRAGWRKVPREPAPLRKNKNKTYTFKTFTCKMQKGQHKKKHSFISLWSLGFLPKILRSRTKHASKWQTRWQTDQITDLQKQNKKRSLL